ncbi:MAG: glycosyltransferase family 4 protein [Vicinamibacterales bacterium]
MANASVDRKALRVAVLARVVYPLHSYGGLQRHAFDLVRSLAARGVEITLITQPLSDSRPSDPAADAIFAAPGVTLETVPYRTFPFAGRRGTTILDRITAYPMFGRRVGQLAARLAERGEIDLVYGLGASALGYARRWPAPASERAPFVFNPQGLEEFGATDPGRAPLKRIAYRPLQRAVRACAHSADRVIATDRVLVEPVLKHLGVDRESVVVVPNAIELSACDRPGSKERIRPLLRSVNLGPDDLLFVGVGRLEANKGFHVLLEALAQLSSSGRLPPSWRLVLVGDGPMRHELARIASDRGLGNQVIFVGRVGDDDLHGWYEAATLFVHPTLYEGSSLVTLEAMAHQRAVVATRAGGLPDKVRPGVNGWLVEPGDAVALADTIAEALQSAERLPAMGLQGRLIVEREFSWSVIANRLLVLFDELVDRRRRVR